jgi:2-polyprenyl-3-methyl-5-hydroxy-6-metoxy-1,4-benzoquinol methylase
MKCNSMDEARLCPVCSAEGMPVMHLPQADVYRCRSCGHAFSENVTDPSDVYDESYFTEKHRNYFMNPDVELYRKIVLNIRKYGPENPRIIDIGCGTGSFLKYLDSQGFHNLTGLDLVVGRHDRIRFIQADILQHKPDEKYDVAVSIANIEHIKDIKKYMETVCGLLEKDGLFIVMTVDEGSIMYLLSRALYRCGISFAAQRLYESHHVNHFTRKSLKKISRLYSFESIEKFSKNFPLRSVDLPKDALAPFLKGAVFSVFLLSSFAGKELLQTQIFRKGL